MERIARFFAAQPQKMRPNLLETVYKCGIAEMAACALVGFVIYWVMAHSQFIVWQQSYSVDSEEIDSQHKELMNFVNDTIRHSTGDKKAEFDYFFLAIKPGIAFLQKHFDTEQAVMLAQNYEGYQGHKAEHEEMIENLNRISDDVLAGRQELNLLEIALFIRDWFLNHIREFDQKAKDCFKRG